MISFSAYHEQWFGNIRGDLLSGLVVALALIPEAIAFSIIAGVDPKVGLFASFSIAVICAFTGGRPGMISAATAATAVLMVTLVRDHGLEYLLAATVLAGVMQIAAGFLKLGYVMRFVSRSVMTGFVNALAILIFMAQLPELIGVPWLTYVMVAAGLAIIYLFPYDPGRAITFDLHLGIDRRCHRIWSGYPDRRRYGGVTGDLAGVPATGHSAQSRNPDDHSAVFGRGGGGGAPRISDDRVHC